MIAALLEVSIWVWVWGGFILFSLASVFLIETGRPFWLSFISIWAVLGLLNALPAKPLDWAIAHPWTLALAVVGWFVAGTAWAIAKWALYAASISRRYRLARSRFLDLGYDSVPGPHDPGLGRWGDELNRVGLSRSDVPPNVKKSKARILTWMIWWPWSAAWTIINDPVTRIFKTIYYRIARRLQRLSDAMFKDFDEFNPS